jgi:hypothetical protein
MSVEEFRERDTDYLGWVAAHPDGYVINIGRSGRGYARLHRATCGTITSRPPFTGPYIKICSTALTDLDRWALGGGGTVPERCGDLLASGRCGPRSSARNTSARGAICSAGAASLTASGPGREGPGRCAARRSLSAISASSCSSGIRLAGNSLLFCTPRVR